MSRITRGGILVALCLVLVAGMVLAGCGKKKEAALQQPGLQFTSYVTGATVDFDEDTLNNMAANGQASFLYNIAKTIYPSVWAANKDTVAQTLFPAPYWRGDGVHTYYTYLSSADQTAVDGAIFAGSIPSKGLTAAEQAVVMNAVESFFGLYADETADHKAMEQNTAWLVLYSSIPDSGASAAAWATEATAWMTALNTYAAANYSGKTYAQLTYVERKTVEATVFAYGTINPEYSFWRLLVKDSFRNGNASARWPDERDAKVAELYPGKTYAQLDCVQKPDLDKEFYKSLDATKQAAVTSQISGMFDLATEQLDGVMPDNENIYYTTLKDLGTDYPYLVTDNSSPTAAADNWLADVTGKPHDYDSSGDFYAELKYGHPQWQAALTHQYFGTDNYAALSTDAMALIDQADTGMRDLSIAQRSDEDDIPLTSNVIYQTLQYKVGSTAAADGWAAEAAAGVDRELALYKWMAYEGFRNGIIAQQVYYPTQLDAVMPTGKTYATLDPCQQGSVAKDMWATLGAGEQGYGASVVSGIFSKAQAEMTDAVAIDQTTLAMTLRNTMASKGFSSETAVANFKADVEDGVLLRSAFYRWLAKESVKESAAAAVLIRESAGEFYIKITNPNEYMICIDKLQLYFRTTAGASEELIDAARQVLEYIWVPAKEGDVDGQVSLKVIAITKTYDILSWLATAGVDTNTARAMANEVFDKIQDGTIVWTAQADIQVSHEDEFQNYSYTLTIA
ncbi:MAG: hypothetical protein JW753_11010 [Dehalococcoidia bacterium]|nr:hypothetical protein [Dehalococcoidia bacterium]